MFLLLDDSTILAHVLRVMFLFNVGFVITRVPNFIVIALQTLTHPSREVLGGLLIIDCRVLPPAMVTAQNQDLF